MNRRINLLKYPGVFGMDQESIAYSGAALASFTLDKRDRILVAHGTDKRKVVFQGSKLIPLRIGSDWFFCDTDVSIDASADIDSGVLETGKNYFVYACISGGALTFKTSLNTTYPTGFNADTSRKIGGFHTLCADVGTISGHPLTGYVAKDILPASVWDLKHRARCGNNAGMVWDERSGIWVDIYLPSGTGANTASANGGTISDTRDWMDFVDDGGAVGKRLLTDREFQLCADGSNERTNITGSADPVTTGGHVDTAGRRMISNIGCEDMCGVMWQWLDTQSYRYDPNGTSVAASQTCTVTHAASPGGNQIYVKFQLDGSPYLCCNMATAQEDKILTFGTNYKITIKHDADAATGGLALYFDDDGPQPNRLYVSNTVYGKDVYVISNNPDYWLSITHSATASTIGVALKYDDGADNRLEANVPSTADQVIDLSAGTAFSYSALPGSKGSLYGQGRFYGDVKLCAGGYWSSGADAGSRARRANNYRRDTYTYIGARFASDPL